MTTNNVQSLFYVIIVCISIAALIISCLAFAKKGENYESKLKLPTRPNCAADLNSCDDSCCNDPGMDDAHWQDDFSGCNWNETWNEGAGGSPDCCCRIPDCSKFLSEQVCSSGGKFCQWDYNNSGKCTNCGAFTIGDPNRWGQCDN